MIVLQIAVALFNTLRIFLQCITIEKSWDLVGTVPETCWSKRTQSISTIGVSVINIVTDFIFAALPIKFLRKVQRPVRERLVVGVLMGLGVFAGVASIIKIKAVTQFGRTSDTLNEGVEIGMWPVIEEQIGLIVICVPCLRSPVQRAVHAFGAMTTRVRHYAQSRCYRRTYNSNDERTEDHRSRSRLSIMLEHGSAIGFKQGSQRTERSYDDALLENTVKRPCEIWCTKEVMVGHDRVSRMPSCEWSGSRLFFKRHEDGPSTLKKDEHTKHMYASSSNIAVRNV
jgi:hypothetical protein